MKVHKNYHIETTYSDDKLTSFNHTVEIGTSSWDDSVLAIRNRWDTNGHFSPRSSSELTPEDAVLVAAVAIMEGLVPADQIIALQSVINTYGNEAANKAFPSKRT